MLIVGRWIAVSLLILITLYPNHSSSQERDATRSITQRIADRWVKPLPHIDGDDDPGLHSMGLVVPDSIQHYWRTHVPNLVHTSAVLPNSVDWSVYDSPVKAQGPCGACWAFAAVAAIENAARQDDLSEQVLISCSGAGSCSGGYYEEALKYIQSYGLPAEACDPYLGANGDCASKSPSPPFLVHIDSMTTTLWGDVARLNDLRAALGNGPVIVTMVVYTDFDAYTGGIYHHSTGPLKGYHAVLVEGYNDEERCFRAKNSWGSRWGEGGYFRISYDDLTNEVRFGGYAAQVSGVRTEFLQTTGMSSPGDGDASRVRAFALEQNFPNPFNPVTIIKYTIAGAGSGLSGRDSRSAGGGPEGQGPGAREAGARGQEPGAGEAGTGGREPGARNTRLIVYDLLGREVARLVDEVQAPGSYTVNFSASGLASGVYIYQLRAGDLVQSRQMILMK